MATTAPPRTSTSSEELVVDVVRAVARSTGDDPLSLPPLGQAIDPEAIDAVVDGPGLVDLTFRYHGHVVTIDGGGNVRVSEVDF